MSKKLSKCIATFDYSDQALIVLSATIGGVPIISFVSFIGAPAGVASAMFTLAFSLTTGMIKKTVTNNKKQKNRNIIKLSCLLKVN